MQKTLNDVSKLPASAAASQLNINKIQAAACMGLSAAASVGLIAWAIKAVF